MSKKARKLIDCPKCGGTGEIPMHRHIMAGTCFKCGGKGKVSVSVDYSPGIFWTCIFAGKPIFCKKARTEAEALRKAKEHFRNHRDAPAFQGITEDQIAVAPRDKAA